MWKSLAHNVNKILLCMSVQINLLLSLRPTSTGIKARSVP